MKIRSGKIQFLFWSAFFATIFAVWIGIAEFNLLLFGAELTDATIRLLFTLYFFVAFFSLAGLITATLINNSFYSRFFSFIIFLLFLSLLAIRTFSD
jgi:hypothetical protein